MKTCTWETIGFYRNHQRHGSLNLLRLSIKRNCDDRQMIANSKHAIEAKIAYTSEINGEFDFHSKFLITIFFIAFSASDGRLIYCLQIYSCKYSTFSLFDIPHSSCIACTFETKQLLWPFKNSDSKGLGVVGWNSILLNGNIKRYILFNNIMFWTKRKSSDVLSSLLSYYHNIMFSVSSSSWLSLWYHYHWFHWHYHVWFQNCFNIFSQFKIWNVGCM